MGVNALRIRDVRPYFVIFFISFLATVLFFSNLLTRNVGEQQVLDLSQAVIESGNVSYAGSLQVSEGGSIRFQDLSVETETLTIILQSASDDQVQRSVTGNIYIRDDSRTSADTLACGFIASPSGQYNAATVKVDSNGALRELLISLDVSGDAELDYEISGIILNAHEPVRFSFWRFGALFVFLTAVYLIWKHKLYQIVYDSENKGHKFCVAAVILLNVAIVCFLGLFLGNIKEDPVYTNYYEDLMASYAESGTIAIPYDAPAELQELDNPYDVTERIEKGIDYSWDMAYFDGAYHVYFGIAPVILLYIPYYLVTGVIAPPGLITTILTFIAVIGLGLLIMEAIRKFRIQANLMMLLLIQFTLPFCVLLYTLQVSADMYYIALLSGITGLIWFLFFSFRAVRGRHPVGRRLFFAGAALAFVVVAGSRPTLVLFGVAVIPLFLEVLWDKERGRGGKALDVTAFVLPILAGAAGLMFYNVIRFGSAVEFGATYQLTIVNAADQTVQLSAQNFVNTLVYYFFYPLGISVVFPYVFMTRPEFSDFGNYFYRGVTVGVLGIPYYLSLFFLPSVRFRNKTERWTVILLLGASFILAYIDYCVGGMIIRYVCDLLVPLALVASILILKLAKLAGKFYGVGLCLIVLSLIIGISLIFSNERNYLLNTQADLYIRVKNLLSLY